MDELHSHRAFADSGRDTFGGAMTHVTGYEDPGDAGLKIKRITIRSPSGRALDRKSVV